MTDQRHSYDELAARLRKLEAAPRAKRRSVLWLFVGIGLALPIGAYAVPNNPLDVPPGNYPFQQGQSIDHDQFNQIFDEIYSHTHVYTNPDTNIQYSMGASYCGPTMGTQDGNFGGYAAGKTLCEQACGSDYAHMCTLDEVRRYVATGGNIATTGWINGAAGVTESGNHRDCDGWQSVDSANRGVYWWSAQQAVDASPCNSSLPILCCD